MLGIILSCFVVAASVWLAVNTRRHVDEGEPPLAPGCWPILGHVGALLRERMHFYPRISKTCQAPIVTLKMVQQSVYLVTTPTLMAEVQKMRTDVLSFEPIKIGVSELLYGASTQATSIARKNMNQEEGKWGVAYDFAHSVRHGLQQGHDLEHMNQCMLQDVTCGLERLKSTDGAEVTIELYDFLRDVLTLATTNSIYGSKNPFQDDTISKSFWMYESRIMMFLLPSAPHIFARSALAARETVVQGLYEYFKNNGVESASRFTKSRHQAWRDNGLSEQDTARFEIGVVIAALANTVPACFWTLLHIFRDRELLSSIRAEIDSSATTTESQTSGIRYMTRTLDLDSLKQKCHLLMSAFRESLRIMTVSVSVRKVLQDATLGGWKLKKDAIVLLSNRFVNLDERNWGSDASDFKSSRFVKGDKQRTHDGKLPGDASFRAFGGGSHLCPGRFFATNEVIAFCAMFIAQFEVCAVQNSAEDGGGVASDNYEANLPYPSTHGTNAIVALMQPDTDIQIKVRPRRGLGNREWKWRSSVED